MIINWRTIMKQYMDAIVKPVAGVGLELRQVPVPQPKAGEVLIKIHKTAICGSDVHIYQWNGYIVHKWAELKDLDEESFNLITVKNKVISLPSKMLDYSADEIMTLFYDRLYYYNKETNN